MNKYFEALADGKKVIIPNQEIWDRLMKYLEDNTTWKWGYNKKPTQNSYWSRYREKTFVMYQYSKIKFGSVNSLDFYEDKPIYINTKKSNLNW